MVVGSDEAQELVSILRRIAVELGTDSVARSDFLRHSGVSQRKIQLAFGSYNGLVEAAGLVPRRFPSAEAPIYSDDDMLDEIVRVMRQPDSKLTRIYFEQTSRMSTSAVERRFGGWINALKAAAAHLDQNGDAGLLSRIAEYTRSVIPVSRRPSQPRRESPITDAASQVEEQEQDEDAGVPAGGSPLAPITPGNIYGDFINATGSPRHVAASAD